MNTPPATDKVKARCPATGCGKTLLINAARWREGLPCPLCKQGPLVKVVAPSATPTVPVVLAAIVPDQPIPAAVVPVVAVRHVPDPAPTAEWLAPEVAAKAAAKVPTAVLVAEPWTEPEEAATYTLEGVRSPPLCPRCMAHLKPNTERCPQCTFDFRGDWEQRHRDMRQMEQEVRERQRRAEALKSDQERQEEADRRDEAALAAALGRIFNP